MKCAGMGVVWVCGGRFMPMLQRGQHKATLGWRRERCWVRRVFWLWRRATRRVAAARVVWVLRVLWENSRVIVGWVG